MTPLNCRTDLPILLIYNIDLTWSDQEIQESHTITQMMVDALIEVGHPVQEVCIHSADLEAALRGYSPDEYLVLNWCEELPGVPHSEAHVAQILERMGFTFTGANSLALFRSQDKPRVRRRLRRKCIPIPAWQVCTSPHIAKSVRFPSIVKPAFEHCSYGITRESVVQTEQELVNRVQYILEQFQQPAMVEDFIDGREFHVGVIGNRSLKVLPPFEIDYSSFADIHDRLCTYESNFDKSSQAYALTAPTLSVDLDPGQIRQIEEVVIAAYQAIGCRDYARMDLRLQDGIFFVLDVNPNADLSPDTSLALAAGQVGYPYGKLGSLLVNLAAKRHQIRLDWHESFF